MQQLSKMLNYWFRNVHKSRFEFFTKLCKYIESFILQQFFQRLIFS